MWFTSLRHIIRVMRVNYIIMKLSQCIDNCGSSFSISENISRMTTSRYRPYFILCPCSFFITAPSMFHHFTDLVSPLNHSGIGRRTTSIIISRQNSKIGITNNLFLWNFRNNKIRSFNRTTNKHAFCGTSKK